MPDKLPLPPSAMALSLSSLLTRRQMCDNIRYHLSDESGFGVWVDEKVRIVLPATSSSCLRQEDAGEPRG